MPRPAEQRMIDRVFGLDMRLRESVVCECKTQCQPEDIKRDSVVGNLYVCTCPVCGTKWGVQQ